MSDHSKTGPLTGSQRAWGGNRGQPVLEEVVSHVWQGTGTGERRGGAGLRGVGWKHLGSQLDKSSS